MMKKLLQKVFFLFTLFASLSATAQWQNGLWTERQAYNWCIPHNGIDFNSGSAVQYPGVQVYEAIEGTAAISSPTGELLFYAGASEIYNKDNVLMQNGAGLIGSSGSSTQSGVIIPKPGSDSVYYLISVGNANIFATGLSYSEIDMSLDGGLGGVTANKNIILNADAKVEKITAVHHSDGESVWVVTHLIESNEYVAYLVSDQGISTTPVTSAIGSFYSGLASTDPAEVSYGPEAVGQLKFSPDGSKLAAAIIDGPNKGLDLFDFNNQTGEITNFVHLAGFLYNPYGCEFSPNGKYLYVADSMGFVLTGNIRQYNTQAENVQDSEILIFVNDPFQPFASSGMQLAPDGRIYIKDVFENTLTSILYPNNEGTACGFQPFYMPLDQGGGIGLTSFIQSYLQSGILAQEGCPGKEVTFTLLRIPDVSAVTWNFGDPASGSNNISTDGLHAFSAGGTYTITAEITSNGAIQVATTQITVPGADGGAVTPPNLVQCLDETQFNLTVQTPLILADLDAAIYNVSYFILLADAQSNANALSDTGNFFSEGQTIFARVTNTMTGCYSIVSFELQFYPELQIPAVADLESCDTGERDNKGVFDLSFQSSILTGGIADRSVRYYATISDAQADEGAISEIQNFENVASPQTIYARVENTVTGCYAIATFDLVVLDGPLIEEKYEIKGCPPYDLTSLTLNNFVLSYFISRENALNVVDPITNPQAYNETGDRPVIFLRAEDINGCGSVAEVHLISEGCEIPRGISPNGDEFNESFDLTGFKVQHLAIFNRYGQEVYSQDNYNDQWHGQDANDNELPTGTYYYAIKLTNGISRTGWVYVNRQI